MVAELGGELVRGGVRLGVVLLIGALGGCPDPNLVEAPVCHMGQTRPCEGACTSKPGKETCGPDGWGACEGAGVLEEELCNGVDDDCDGLVDESWPEAGESCGTDEGVCVPGHVACDRGFLICAGGVRPGAELCNGLDDDCDGEVDEDVPERLCYDGPESTRGVGTCHAGVLLCRGGRAVCEGQKTPEVPNCMNGLDNDCDGFLDRPIQASEVDVVLLIDKSGSMLFAFEALRPAVLRFLEAVTDAPEVRVAIVSVPGAQTLSQCTLESPLAPPSEVVSLVRDMRTDGGGNEPTFDCAMGIAHPQRPLGIEWRPGARRVAVMFSDEDCQSAWCIESCGRAGEPPGSVHWCEGAGFGASHRLTLDETAGMLEAQGVRLEIFTTDALTEYYRPLAERSGGQVRSLVQASDRLGEEIQGVLMSSVCE